MKSMNDPFSSRSSVDNNNLGLTRQSKLEHFGFDMLPRSSKVLKRQSCIENSKLIQDSLVHTQCSQKSKKIRTIE